MKQIFLYKTDVHVSMNTHHCTHAHIHTHIHIHTDIHIHMHKYAHTYSYVLTHTNVHSHTPSHAHSLSLSLSVSPSLSLSLLLPYEGSKWQAEKDRQSSRWIRNKIPAQPPSRYRILTIRLVCMCSRFKRCKIRIKNWWYSGSWRQLK